MLPETVKARLSTEFRFAADKMAGTPDLGEKLYFFSAFFGEVNRALNQFWTPELGLAHLVLRETHQLINGRLNMPTPGTRIPPELPEALDRLAAGLATLFESERIDETKLYQALARAAELGYVATGNGYYLYLKRQIRL